MDFWRRMCFDLREFGYYQIIQIVGGDHSLEYIYVKYDSERDFHDYMTLDEHNKIRTSCDLYKDIIDVIDDKTIRYFTSMEDCIQSILLDIHASLDETNVNKFFKLLAMKIDYRH